MCRRALGEYQTRRLPHNLKKEDYALDAQLKRGLTEACILKLLTRGDSYGYQLVREAEEVLSISESTLYPVLRRLQKDECLEVYDRECSGRTRRYYKVTSRGWAQLHLYESEWRSYSGKITGLFEGRPVKRSEA